jgi:hypothetical protein
MMWQRIDEVLLRKKCRLKWSVHAQIEGLEAHVGRRGRIRIKGALPLTAVPGEASDMSAAAAATEMAPGRQGSASSGMVVDVHGLELRVRNVYTGARTLPSAFSWHGYPVAGQHAYLQ